MPPSVDNRPLEVVTVTRAVVTAVQQIFLRVLRVAFQRHLLSH